MRVSVAAVAVGLLWFVCGRHLSEEWRYNEQYSYGWFIPFFSAYLFWLRWQDRPEPKMANRGARIVAVSVIALAALLLLPLRVFEIGSSDWRPLAWLHTSAVVGITLALIYHSGGRAWLWHFSFPVAFFLTGVAWPTAIEEPIVQGLMRVSASIAAETLALFGVPAEATGNLIQLPAGVVGVNEACSGVRSLQTAIMIGLLFGELKRLRFLSRLWLIAVGVGIALVANLLRVLFLVSMAFSAGDVKAVDRWHDVTGLAIVVLVFAGTMWVGGRFNERSTEQPQAANCSAYARPILPPVAVTLLLLAWTIAVEVGAEGWYRMHEHNLVATPAWEVRWPESAPGYREITVDDRVRAQLRFDEGREATWRSASESGETNYLFFFRWNAGSGTILRARAHRPDICLPSAGWRQVGPDAVKAFPVAGGLSLPFRHFTFTRTDNDLIHAHAYYSLHEDRIHSVEGIASDSAGVFSNWDLADRWRIVQSGIRNLGQQVVQVMVLAPAESDPVADEHFAALVREVITPK